MPRKPKKPTHGGYRPGAGRPAVLPDSRLVAVRLPLATIADIKARGETVTAAVRSALKSAGYEQS